jgi:hypothetical protein
VEASIRYLPLYPDDENVIFNEKFILNAPNSLFEILPAFSNLSETIHVIEVPSVSNGMVLRVLMNADLDKAVGILSPRASSAFSEEEMQDLLMSGKPNHWRWRTEMAEKLAAQLDPVKHGIKAMYLAGSTQNTTAQAGSDIDLLINFTGSTAQQQDLQNWLEGWSLCLDEINFMRTGYKAGGLLDIHFVNENDITNLKSLSEKLRIPLDGLKQLTLGKGPNHQS